MRPAAQMSANSVEMNNESPLATLSTRAFWLFSALAILSLGLVLFGNLYGERMALAGHSPDPAPLEIVIGNDVLSVPTNMIRLPDQRVSGLTESISLYVHWPTKQGFTVEQAPAFNSVDGQGSDIIFITFKVRDRLMTMRDRFDPVYKKAVTGPVKTIYSGLNVQALMPALGYNDEVLVWSSPRLSIEPDFIARCTNAEHENYIAPCETDMFVGRSLEMNVRFSQQMLVRWPTLNKELSSFAASLQIVTN